MNFNSIRHKTKQLNFTTTSAQRDDLLYQIGTDAQLITFKDVNQIQGGHLSPEIRSKILTWLRRHANEIGLTKSS